MRCVGSSEAAYKLFAFPIASQYPAVQELRVHLKDGQTVVFEEHRIHEGMESSRKTELTAFLPRPVQCTGLGHYVACE